MFYLERGNYDSSISLRFNLQPALYQQIKKVDQNGKPLQNAEFELYAVETPAGVDLENVADVKLQQVKPEGAALAKLVTDANGEARFLSGTTSRDGQEQAFNFSDRYNPRRALPALHPGARRRLPTDISRCQATCCCASIPPTRCSR